MQYIQKMQAKHFHKTKISYFFTPCFVKCLCSKNSVGIIVSTIIPSCKNTKYTEIISKFVSSFIKIKIKIDNIVRMIPKTKFNPPQHLCAYFHVSSFILDIVLRYPDIHCRSLGGLFFHVYPNIIIDNGTKSEQIHKNINITATSFLSIP